MTIVRWDPFRNVSALQERINRMFEETFPRTTEDEDLAACAWRPVMDIYETDDGLVMVVDLPGDAKNDVSVEVRNNVMTLKGERRIDPDIEEQRYIRRERCFGTFQRSFALREPVAPDRIKARFNNGVLTVHVVRPAEELPRQITVDVE